jgi:hypothetical protein
MSMSPLRQPLHIFRKDAIHLWPETLVSIALLAAFAWADAQTWLPSDGGFNPAAFGAGILRFLIVISWLILISRLVHDEELVGDRQFWITRPYTWYGLLAAKIVYLVVFIGVPFLIMQAWLLHHAGLYPTHLVPALLKNLLFVALTFLLPLLAIAAVTATFIRYISSVLGGFIYLFAVVAVTAYNAPESLVAPYIGYILSGALLALIVAALVLQYWKRKALIPRLLLVGLPLVFVLFALLTPVNLLSDHRYPNVAAGTATFDSDPMRQQPDGRTFLFQHKVVLDIPVQVQLPGLDPKAYVDVERVRLTLDGPNGFHYTSDWSTGQAQLSPDSPASVLQVRVPEKVYNKVHGQPVALHLQLGTQTFSPGKPYSVLATESAFPAPDHAACTVSADDGTLDCRFPFTNADFTLISATVHDGNCLMPGQRSATAYGTIAPSSSPLGFSPIEVDRVKLRLGQSNIPLCPDTRTTFVQYAPGAYGRMSLDIPSITLDPYVHRIQVRPTGTPPPTAAPQ